jgi:hypothetical protein
MKLTNIIIGVLLLAGMAMADNDVVVHVNYPHDEFYIGAANLIEIWIENDIELGAFSLGFEFSGYSGQIDWMLDYGSQEPALFELKMSEQWDVEVATQFSMDDNVLDDSVLVAGVAIFTQNSLPPSTSSKCISLVLNIPSGEPSGQICIDNIWTPPAGDWTYSEPGGPMIAPNYFGCVNTSPDQPDCPAVCFPVITQWFVCGDVNGDSSVNINDFLLIYQMIFENAPIGNPITAADIDCSGRVNMADAGYLLSYIFFGGDAPCTPCP